MEFENLFENMSMLCESWRSSSVVLSAHATTTKLWQVLNTRLLLPRNKWLTAVSFESVWCRQWAIVGQDILLWISSLPARLRKLPDRLLHADASVQSWVPVHSHIEKANISVNVLDEKFQVSKMGCEVSRFPFTWTGQNLLQTHFPGQPLSHSSLKFLWETSRNSRVL